MTESSPKPPSKKFLLAVIAALSLVLLALLAQGFTRPQGMSRAEREWLKGEGAFFVKKNCTACHSISAFGIRTANFGPDLSTAAVDTERRFGKSLDEFFRNPNGTMSIVLSSRIPLTEAEKQEAVRLLKIAYQRTLEQPGTLKPPTPPTDSR